MREKLWEAISGIDDRYLTEADPYAAKIVNGRTFSKEKGWRLAGAMAMLLIVFTLVRILPIRETEEQSASVQSDMVLGQQSEEKTALFDELPQMICGGQLQEIFLSEEGVSRAEYLSEDGKLMAEVLRMNESDEEKSQPFALYDTIAVTWEWNMDGYHYTLIVYDETPDSSTVESLMQEIR